MQIFGSLGGHLCIPLKKNKKAMVKKAHSGDREQKVGNPNESDHLLLVRQTIVVCRTTT